MQTEYREFGFYHVDVSYLKYLHDHVDSEVYYTEDKAYERKPFVGIIVGIGHYTYFIPLTSSKLKHRKWKNVDSGHFLVYEVIGKDEIGFSDMVYKTRDDKTVFQLLAVLDLKKMIPVPEGLYFRVDFSAEKDIRYKNLLEKEYRFCKRIKNVITDKIQKIYTAQKETGRIYRFYCDFSLLEKACDRYCLSIKK